MAPAGEVHAVRIVLADRCVSVPFHLLECWERVHRGEPEELQILIGRRSPMVRGHGLEVLHSALDTGTARQVRVGAGGKGGEGQIQITEITLSTAPSALTPYSNPMNSSQNHPSKDSPTPSTRLLPLLASAGLPFIGS
jgi:hypothetical protein